ncbi:uncharacterized protein SCHCODRAFT_02663885 [Schizophyllum commune H4-8]|uniref:uncharacterized protein n=1 Tax=Schizophyllum commune (strain H4-8 / FGSC 9210) TaxID=578458 RepID=UPI00215FAFAA|nr:uncharacterized protein SCHCODRAFT_02663885 [Schizophyllum commune H4-8]KAI5896021.1 hypothetical protein SCHCODRAFT_02663885 [Schizophyllum commune H4-8]
MFSSPTGQSGTGANSSLAAGPSSSPLPKRKGSTEEMAEEAEVARMRAALDNAERGMYGEDPTLPTPLNTLRKRLGALISETNLSPNRVVDRGVTYSSSRARFSLNIDFTTFLEDVVSSTQAVMDLLYTALQEDDENPAKGWQFDPGGTLFKGLTEARSIRPSQVPRAHRGKAGEEGSDPLVASLHAALRLRRDAEL